MKKLFLFMKKKKSIHTKEVGPKLDPTLKEIKVSKNLLTNIKTIKGIFNYEKNSDFILGEVYIKSIKRRGIIFYIEGTA